jgi:Pentapeptide repeats (8 copies)
MRRFLAYAASAAVVGVVLLAVLLHSGAHQQWPQAIGLAALIVTGVLVVIGCLTLFPELLLRRSGLDGVERAKAENDARGTLIQAVGGAALLVGAYVTWSQLGATQQQVSIVARQQVNDQFSRAIEQLGNKASPGVRIGGIYSLSQLAHDAPDQNYPVLDILASYVREHAPLPREGLKDAAQLGSLRLRAPDVETALVQISTLKRVPPATVLLDHSELAGAELAGTRLPWVTFNGSDLRNAEFQNSILHHAHLNDTDLRGASFAGADLSETVVQQANLGGVILRSTNLSGAYLGGSSVCGTDLSSAKLSDLARRPTLLYADRKTRWPPGFDVSGASGDVEVALVTPSLLKQLNNYVPRTLFEGCTLA